MEHLESNGNVFNVYNLWIYDVSLLSENVWKFKKTQCCTFLISCFLFFILELPIWAVFSAAWQISHDPVMCFSMETVSFKLNISDLQVDAFQLVIEAPLLRFSPFRAREHVDKFGFLLRECSADKNLWEWRGNFAHHYEYPCPVDSGVSWRLVMCSDVR